MPNDTEYLCRCRDCSFEVKGPADQVTSLASTHELRNPGHWVDQHPMK